MTPTAGRRVRATAIALAAAACVAAPARANDTSAELATGGLIFVQNDNVEMRSEDLAISAKEVAVRYRFFNKSAGDVTVLVAFPMPDVRIEEQDQNISLPTEDPVNLLAFTTTVNGKPVQTQVEQHVFAAGIDRTQLLTSLHIPLAPHLAATNDALDRLPREQWDELTRIGLAEIEEYDIGKGMQKHLAARWSLRTTFYWEQTFAAKAETVIEHRYRPSVGGSVQTSLGAPASAKEAWYDDYKRKYCLDSDFFAVHRALAQGGEKRVRAALCRGAHRLHPAHRRQLVGADRAVPSHRRQGRARQPGQLLRGGREEDQRHQIRDEQDQLFAGRRSGGADPEEDAQPIRHFSACSVGRKLLSLMIRWLRAIIALDQNNVARGIALTESFGVLVFRRIPARERGFIIVEFDDHDT